MSELKPCPFCGCDLGHMIRGAETRATNTVHYCPVMGKITFDDHVSMGTFRDAWNTRDATIDIKASMDRETAFARGVIKGMELSSDT